MQIPKRRSEKQKQPDTGPVYLTREGFDKLKRNIARLEQSLPTAIKEVEQTKEYGDFSENEEYKQAKRRLRGMHTRIFYLNDRLNRAELFEPGKNKSSVVQLGSTVELEVAGESKTFQILGTYETDPAAGKISNASPLGLALLGHKTGDRVVLEVKGQAVVYRIVNIK